MEKSDKNLVSQFLKKLFTKEEQEIKGLLHRQFLISGKQNEKLKNKLSSLRKLKKEIESLVDNSTGTLST